MAKAKATRGATPKLPEVTLEYNKGTNNLKKVTKRRVRIKSQVSMLQTEEKQLSLTQKRNREAQSTGMDDEELIVDPVSIVKSTNNMSKEVVKRIHLELT